MQKLLTRNLEVPELRILLVLLSHQLQEGEPLVASIKEVGLACGVYKRLATSLKKLEDCGALEMKQFGRSEYIYYVNTDLATWNTVKPKKKTMPVQDSQSYKLAQEMFEEIKKAYPSAKEPSFFSWGRDMDLMLRVDGRKLSDVRRVMRWAIQDSFWCSNIRSPRKLRKHFERLDIQSKRKKKGTYSKPSSEGEFGGGEVAL